MKTAKELLLDAAFLTDRAQEKFTALKSDNVKLGEAEAIRDCLSVAAAKMTVVAGLIAGNEPPKTGD